MSARRDRAARVLVCRQWWRVCWIYGDQEKYYRALYRRRDDGGPHGALASWACREAGEVLQEPWSREEGCPQRSWGREEDGPSSSTLVPWTRREDHPESTSPPSLPTWTIRENPQKTNNYPSLPPSRTSLETHPQDPKGQSNTPEIHHPAWSNRTSSSLQPTGSHPWSRKDIRKRSPSQTYSPPILHHRPQHKLSSPTPSISPDRGGSMAEGGKPAVDSPASRLSDDDSGCALEEYTWAPPGLTPHQVYLYFSCLPEEKIPYVGSAGEKWRRWELVRQLPPQDSDPAYCGPISELERQQLVAFAAERRRDCLGRGLPRQLSSPTPCAECEEMISRGDMCVEVSRGTPGKLWHPSCFICSVCRQLLVDLIYFYDRGNLYCGRHHSETIKPRCSACDEIIFADECTEAEGKAWHMKHFACTECDKQLGGQRYVMREGRPYCLNCFDTLFAEFCDSCGEPIKVDDGEMSHEGQHWHATDSCFSCRVCRVPLLGRPFLPRRGAIFCSVSCSKGEPPSNRDHTRSSRVSNQPSKPSQKSRCTERWKESQGKWEHGPSSRRGEKNCRVVARRQDVHSTNPDLPSPEYELPNPDFSLSSSDNLQNQPKVHQPLLESTLKELNRREEASDLPKTDARKKDESQLEKFIADSRDRLKSDDRLRSDIERIKPDIERHGPDIERLRPDIERIGSEVERLRPDIERLDLEKIRPEMDLFVNRRPGETSDEGDYQDYRKVPDSTVAEGMDMRLFLERVSEEGCERIIVESEVEEVLWKWRGRRGGAGRNDGGCSLKMRRRKEMEGGRKNLSVRFRCVEPGSSRRELPALPSTSPSRQASTSRVDTSDSESSTSSCSTCSSSSSTDDLSAYQLPPRRAYGGVRISYVPNDAIACAKRQAPHPQSPQSPDKPDDKSCVIS